MTAHDQQASSAGPGKALRQARQDSKLSVEEVALQLHLAPRQIDALERDDYTNLPQPTYVRGYVRSYAQLLGLAVEPLLDAYNRSQSLHAPVAPTSLASALASETHSGDGHMKIISLLVAVLVIGFAAAWWQGRDTQAPRRGEAVPTIVQTEPPASEMPPMGATAPESGATVPANPPSTPQPNMSNEASAKSEPKPEAPREATPRTPARVIGQPLDAPAPSTPLGGGQARVVLRAAQDSWAEVRDADGKRLLYETVPAGRMVSIVGAAPLNVFLGNVDGVKIEANGRAFDPRPYKRGVIARFTLSAPAATTAPTPSPSPPTATVEAPAHAAPVAPAATAHKRNAAPAAPAPQPEPVAPSMPAPAPPATPSDNTPAQ